MANDSIQAASGVFLRCGTESVGDQLINVCHAAGYTMPTFIFWAATLILALFVASSAALFLQCYSLASALLRVSRQVRGLPRAEEHRLTPYDLSLLSGIMLAEPVVEPCWHRFADTLLVLPHGDEVFATQSVEDAFARQPMIEDNVHGAFFAAVPGILTGVGLLMTFVAILDGLSHVSVTANMDVKGIGGLINGLSGKFVSSVVAVTCAVLFVFVERIAYSRPARAYSELISSLRSRFRRRTTEHLLFEIQNQLASQAAAQEGFAHALARLERGKGT